MVQVRFVLVALLGLLATAVGQAQQLELERARPLSPPPQQHQPVSTLYASTGDGLYTLERNTGALQFIGEFHVTLGQYRVFLDSLTYCPETGMFYAIARGYGYLYAINRYTGLATLVGDTGLGPMIYSPITYNPRTRRLVAVHIHYATADPADGIYDIDPRSARAVLLAPYRPPIWPISIACDWRGQLWTATSGNVAGMIYALDPQTGKYLPGGGFTHIYVGFFSLAFEPWTSTLFADRTSAGNYPIALCTVNPYTAQTLSVQAALTTNVFMAFGPLQ
jgi:hypothetical protein